MRFPFIQLPQWTMAKPLLWLLLTNRHDPHARSQIWPAIIDTGADLSTAPESLCPMIGHDFARGAPVDPVTGLGGPSLACHVHSTEVSILETLPTGLPNFGAAVLPSVLLELTFVQNIGGVAAVGVILLGQSDFLQRFDYHQCRSRGYFEIIPAQNP